MPNFARPRRARPVEAEAVVTPVTTKVGAASRATMTAHRIRKLFIFSVRPSQKYPSGWTTKQGVQSDGKQWGPFIKEIIAVCKMPKNVIFVIISSAQFSKLYERSKTVELFEKRDKETLDFHLLFKVQKAHPIIIEHFET